MTKYILNSGGLRKNPEFAKKFFTEVVKGLGKNPKILICCFAQPREDWEEIFEVDKKGIPALVPKGTNVKLELAFPDNFKEQMKNSDAIYIRGGDDNLLQYWLRKFDIPKIWKDKVVAANSAGSDALCKYFWTCDWRKCMNGLGLIPIKFLPHYNSSYGEDDPRGPVDWKKAYDELKKCGDSKLPIYALEEGHYEVFEQ